jgi:hypothetical protein
MQTLTEAYDARCRIVYVEQWVHVAGLSETREVKSEPVFTSPRTAFETAAAHLNERVKVRADPNRWTTVQFTVNADVKVDHLPAGSPK